ncbi:MAG TPA: hypothetical protein VF730_18280 [Terracidiphilus sp.]
MTVRDTPHDTSENHSRSLERLQSATAGLQPIQWASLGVDQQKAFVAGTYSEYAALIGEIVQSSNNCVDKYEQYMRAHVVWRWIVIISTGVIALLNILVTHSSAINPKPWWAGSLSVTASVFAVLVTIVATLEGFTNSAERAQGYRESREMFVDVSREFTAAWDNYVEPLKDGPEACANAAELHKRLIAADRELRARFKNLTMERQQHGGSE